MTGDREGAMTNDAMPAGPVLDTSVAPTKAKKVGDLKPDLLLTQEHNLCPGCGEPIALRLFLESLSELGVAQRSVMVAGIGCYTAFTTTVDVDLVQALHGRAPAGATPAKGTRPRPAAVPLPGGRGKVRARR